MGNRIGHKMKWRWVLAVFVLVLAPILVVGQGGKRALTFEDIMKFREIHNPLISEDGRVVAYNCQPDRGNGEVIVYLVQNGQSYSIARGKGPVLTKNGRFAAAVLSPDALELEKAKEKDKLKTGLALLETGSGKVTTFERVADFAFSGDSLWLCFRFFPEEEKEEKEKPPLLEKGEKEGEKTAEKKPEAEKKEDKWAKKTGPLVLYHLETGQQTRIEKVLFYAFDPAGHFLAYSVYEEQGGGCGLFERDLTKPGLPEKIIGKEIFSVYSNLTWSKKGSKLAFLVHREPDREKEISATAGKKEPVQGLWLHEGLPGKGRLLVGKSNIPRGYMIPAENKFTFTEDEKRLFFGLDPIAEYYFYNPEEEDKIKDKGKDKEPEKLEEKDLFDRERILQKRGLDVWHWQDGLINSNQKGMWEERKLRTYPAVYHLEQNRLLALADPEMPEVKAVENAHFALGLTRQPYLRESTWDETYQDVYLVNLQNGASKKILSRFQHDVFLSPGGKYVAYYRDKGWHLFNTATFQTLEMTTAIPTPFYDEDHDVPGDVPGYGLAGWLEGDKGVLIYDKFDIWQFFTGSSRFVCLTGGRGRKEKLIFRIKQLDAEQKFFKEGEKLLLSAYSDEKKFTHFYAGVVGQTQVKPLLEGEHKYTFELKAKKADRLIYTRESFEEFPDLWIADQDFTSPQKITAANPQMKEFFWGKACLLDWQSLDGIRLQGAVFLPEDFDPAKRYPVLVYYYELSSNRLYDYSQMVVNHRPNFPFYTGNGYVVFLPDVRFQVGRPGFSATKCLVPGVQKLIDLGIADPKAIGLHGHSWSGYQTAFVITQTDIFAAAIAGAPVANMTSAYSGIRWGSGLARQFQYEKFQSRIGKSLWEAPQLYIENSPVFFADRIDTPLLIEHGDQDDAVPWYQAIELYLAMRRLDKTCIYLQYNDEQHLLKKYPNKLDYAIKMKEFLDHYLKGEKAPDWMTQGVLYRKTK